MEKDKLSPIQYYSAGHLFSLAKAAHERTKGGKSPQEPGKSDALVALILSASSLEAFINELADMASKKLDHLGLKQPDSVNAFAAIMEEIENSRGSIRLKFHQANLIFTGTHFDTNSQPFQDFSSLFRVRDALLHLKPQSEFATNSDNKIIRISTPKPLSGLPKNILAKHKTEVVASWTAMISTQAVARWACNTAVEMVQSILSILPDSNLKKSAVRAYGNIFVSVE